MPTLTRGTPTDRVRRGYLVSPDVWAIASKGIWVSGQSLDFLNDCQYEFMFAESSIMAQHSKPSLMGTIQNAVHVVVAGEQSITAQHFESSLNMQKKC